MEIRTPTPGTYPYQMVRLACTKCDRHGQYKRERLISEHGADILLPDLRHVLARCERRPKLGGDACGLYYPDLIPQSD
ncbi:MAG TPA: hypothetical protein VNZ53_04115 [Steroidobacteraceae bacterium]|jgi:hypothetical protein|nr:hypothetical protein [Steroidobacteraceae bacterium]